MTPPLHLLFRLLRVRPVTALHRLSLLLVLLQFSHAAERDLYIIAGQSNAVGFDADPTRLKADPIDANVPFWWQCGDPRPDGYDSSSSGRWTTLQAQPKGTPGPKDPWGNFSHAEGGFGPEIGFARTLARAERRPFSILKAAWSGTSVAKDWRVTGPLGPCYLSLLTNVREATEAAAAAGTLLVPRALIWVQGESDSFTPADRDAYAVQLEALIARLRQDLDRPNLIALIGVNALYRAQPLGTATKPTDAMRAIVEAQQTVAARPSSNTHFIDTLGAALQNQYHFSAEGTLDVGRRFAERLLQLEEVQRTATPSPYAERFLLSSEGSGRATAYLESGKIITFQGRTHVAWLDTPPEGFRIRIRTLDRSTGQWSPAWTIGEAADNHGGPALTVDAAGYLHVVFYSHHHPFRYRKSVRPNDASEWGPVEEFGLHLTYPTLLCAADGTLILSARHSYDDKPWELDLWTKSPNGSWSPQGAILRSRRSNYAQFAASMAWAPDHRQLYLSYRIYEMPDYEKKDAITSVGCITSPDSGKTWNRIDGRRLALPATIDTLDAIVTCDSREGRIADSGSMAVSPTGVPHVIYSVKVQETAQAYLATPTHSGGWRHLHLNAFLPPAQRNQALSLQGGVTFTAAGQPAIICTAMNHAFGEEPWGHPSTGLVKFTSSDQGLSFRALPLTPSDSKTPHWLPNLEKPTGFNETPASPSFIYTEGDAGAGLKDVLRNRVWWVPID